jgi:long-chain acyl-CoA synthetase
MNVHAADLEAAMAKQPGVRACAVVACPVGATTEAVAVTIFPGSDEDLQIAVVAANTELADYQRIRRWLRWPDVAFPYTTTGKLLRRKIADWACAALSGREAVLQSSRQDGLLELISAVTGEKIAEVSDDALLSEDLRLDSLGRVQLQSLLEQRLGTELPDDSMTAIRTLRDLRRLVGRGAPAVEGGSTPAGPVKSATAGGATAASGPPTASAPAVPAEEHLYPHWPWWAPIQCLRILFIEAVMRPLVWLLANPKVIRDAGELPSGPLLLIANHVTTYDGALVLYALPPKLRRRVAIAMSGEMLLSFRKARHQQEFSLRFLGPVAYLAMTTLFNVFPLPRSSGFRRSFAHAGEAMDRGYSVLIFPEGHRSEDGTLQPFRSGIGLLATQARVPVLPVALKGLGELKKQGRGWFRSGKLAIHVGTVVPFDETTAPSERTHALEETVRSL